jgi:hypothetical protein
MLGCFAEDSCDQVGLGMPFSRLLWALSSSQQVSINQIFKPRIACFYRASSSMIVGAAGFTRVTKGGLLVAECCRATARPKSRSG